MHQNSALKGIDHPKMKMVPNMYEFLSSAEHKRRYFEGRIWLTKQLMELMTF